MSASLRHLGAVPLFALAIALPGCGSDDESAPGRVGAGATTTAPAGTTTATQALPSDPRARLRAVAAALAKVKSMHLEGSATDADGESTVVGDLSAAGNARVALRSAKQNLEFRVLGADTFLRADQSFWEDSGGGDDDPEIARRLADRWVSLPTSTAGFEEQLDDLRPSTLAKCVTVNVGKLTDAGTAEVDGQRAFVLEDDGDVPGGTPGRLYFAADGPPVPLRIVQTGKSRSGGQEVEGCGDDDDTTSRSDVRLSRFDEPLRVTAPEGALRIPTPGDEGRATT